MGAGLLMALDTIFKEAGVYSQVERTVLLESLAKKELPVIPKEKRNSHSGFIVIVETDADFPNSESISPVQVLTVMRELGIRVYFMIFTKNSPAAVIRAVRDTGGKEYFIAPELISKPKVLEEELKSVFNDINTLNPRENKTVSGIKPRTFARELGAVLAALSFLYILTFLAEEAMWRIRKAINKKGGGPHV